MGYIAIKVEDSVGERFKELAKNDGLTMTALLEKLMQGEIGGETNERLDKLAEWLPKRLDELERKIEKAGSSPMAVLDAIDKKNEKPIPKEMEGLQPDELPPCCQKAYANMAYGEGVGELCPHWEKAYNNFNQLEYKNTLTGRYMSDRAYDKYV